MEEMNENKVVSMSFAAIDPFYERLIESPSEKKMGSREWVQWGEKNTYPQYIAGLCREVPTLRTIVLGLADYVCGDAVMASRGLPGRAPLCFDRYGATARDIVARTAKQVASHGCICWKINRNNNGEVGEIEPIKVERIRSNEDNTAFFYSEKWGKTNSDYIVYPKFVPEDTAIPTSILYVKLWGDETYPEPIFAASVKACETERGIDEYHLGNISRGFMGSYIVNFNGGLPTDEEKEEIERDFNAKFAGSKNAGRIMFAWNRNIQNRVTLEKMEVSDFGEKYATLSENCRQQIFTAFRANPNLFGISTAQGFNAEEYESSFKLFNRTMVQPIQAYILDAFEKVLGEKGVVAIKPFSLEGEGENIEI